MARLETSLKLSLNVTQPERTAALPARRCGRYQPGAGSRLEQQAEHSFFTAL